MMNHGIKFVGPLCLAAQLATPASVALAGEHHKPMGRPGPGQQPALDVFVIDNDPTGNAVRAFRTTPQGGLQAAGVFPTGGFGTGTGLGSQGALTLDDAGQYLFVVNAGSDEISSFEVVGKDLVLRDVISSGGAMPVSLDVEGDVLYVVNAGSADEAANISGYRVAAGRLTPIENGLQPLSEAAPGPAQIGLTPGGRYLVVTEKGTNALTSYALSEDGAPLEATFTPSSGQTPFGFAFDENGILVVSEAFGGAAGASAVSSYWLSNDGTLLPITASVPTGQSAACWVAVTGDGRFAYTSNTGSDTLTGLSVAGGAVELFADGGATAVTGDGPADSDFDANSSHLYVLNGAGDTIDVFRRGRRGALRHTGEAVGLPTTAVGLVAR